MSEAAMSEAAMSEAAMSEAALPDHDDIPVAEMPDNFRPGPDGSWDGDRLHCGIVGLRLIGGVRVARWDGEFGYSLPDAYRLFDLAAAAIALGWQPLLGADSRFLRAHLDLSQSGLGRAVGVTAASVARWERVPDGRLPRWADRALRGYVAAALGLAGMAERLAAKERRKATPRRLVLVWDHDAGTWRTGDNNFGPGNTPLGNPLDDRRLVATLRAGDPFAGRRTARIIARLEARDLEDAMARVPALVSGLSPRVRRCWYLCDHLGIAVAGPGLEASRRASP